MLVLTVMLVVIVPEEIITQGTNLLVTADL
jgi:hypothetical protein